MATAGAAVAGGVATMVMLLVVQVGTYRDCVRRATTVADQRLLILAERWRQPGRG